MKTLSEHSEYGIIGTSYYLLRFALIVIPVIIFCYSIYVDSLLGDGLWSSAVGVGPLAVTCILTIFSIVSAVLAVLFFFLVIIFSSLFILYRQLFICHYDVSQLSIIFRVQYFPKSGSSQL